MLLLSVLQGLLEIAAGLLTQAKLGMVGLVLLFGLGVGIRHGTTAWPSGPPSC